MGDAVGAVTGAVGDVVGGVVGGTQQGVAKQMGPAFKGQTREVDPNAFNVTAARGVEHKARKLATRAGKRATQAQRQQQQARRGQRGLISQLQAQSAGRGPSLAEAQLRSAQDRSLKQQLAAAAAQRGGNQASLQRALARSQAEQAATVGQQAAQARIQEQLAARQQLAGALQSQRSQDLQAQNLQEQLQNQRLAQQLGASQAQQQASAALENLQTQQFLAAQGLSAQGVAAQQQAASQLTGGLFGGTAQVLAASDENMKKEIKGEKGKTTDKNSEEYKEKQKNAKKIGDSIRETGDAMGRSQEGLKSAGRGQFERALSAVSDKKSKKGYSDKNMKNSKKSKEFNPKSFLDALNAKSYEYKEEFKNMPEAGEGRFLGIMAQDLEKAGPVGRSMVKETESGKMVDYGKGFGAILAAQAHLNKRLGELESKKKRRS